MIDRKRMRGRVKIRYKMCQLLFPASLLPHLYGDSITMEHIQHREKHTIEPSTVNTTKITTKLILVV